MEKLSVVKSFSVDGGSKSGKSKFTDEEFCAENPFVSGASAGSAVSEVSKNFSSKSGRSKSGVEESFISGASVESAVSGVSKRQSQEYQSPV